MGENKEKLLCLLLENLHQEYSDNVCDVLYLITEEICKNENCELSDVSLISKGSYSSVFGIGHKVMKLSKDRASIDFPNNPYIVKPLLRRFLDKNLFIEVTEKVNTNIKISNQELYNLYAEVRDSGLVWTDVNKRNVGVLEKDNIIYWNYYLNPSDIALKFNDKIYGPVRKKGQLIILDADHIFKENDNYFLEDDSYSTAFNFQYTMDKKRRKK